MKKLKELITKPEEPQKLNQFVLDMYQLIKINNELINRLIIDMHYLTNEMIEIRKILAEDKSIKIRFKSNGK